MKVRIKFSKTGCMKFIGHLDIMRYFQKAIKRAGIDIAYSEGYNPHQIMSFASPLGVGLTSEGEYLDIEVHSQIPSAEGVKRLNDTMVDGMKITQFRYLPEKTPNAMSSIQAGEYYIFLKESSSFSPLFDSIASLSDGFLSFIRQQEIIVTKETKKGEQTFDLKPHIYEWEAIMLPETGVTLRLLLATGSETNIKPEFVLQNVLAFNHYEINLMDYQIHRLELYTRQEDAFISLGDLGKDAK